MPIGPVQLLVVGFDRPDFSGEVLAGVALADAWIHPADLVAAGLDAEDAAVADG